MYINNFSSNVSDLIQEYIPKARLRSNRTSMLLQPKLLRPETYTGFYSNIIVTIWDQLPPELRVDHSYSIFVVELEDIYSRMGKDTFMCYNVCSWTSTCRCQACARF